MRKTAIVLSALAICFASNAKAETGYLVAKSAKSGDILGESAVVGFVGQITVSDFVFTSEFKYPNAAASKFNRPNPIVSFKMPYSKAVPLLLSAASNGDAFTEFKFSAVQSNQSGTRAFAVYSFKNVHINGIEISHNDDRSGDVEVSILYQNLTINYTPTDKAGKLGADISGTDNVLQ